MSSPAFPSVNSMLAPVQALSSLALGGTQKLAALQLNNFQAYLAMGMDHVKALATVQTPDDLQALAARQAELIQRLGARAAADAQEIARLGADVGAAMQKVVLEGTRNIGPM